MSRAFLVAGAVALLPASAFAYIEARAYIKAGFRSEAEYREHLDKIARATEAIRRDPKDPVAYFHRGRVYSRQHQYWQALADYDRALKLDPKFAQAYYRRGQTLWQWGLRAKGLADVEKAVQLDPRLVEAQVFFAVHTDDLTKAIQAAKQACKGTEYREEICLQLLASLYAQSGDFDNAVRWQRKALELPVFGSAEARKRLENYRRGKRNEWGIDWYLVGRGPEASGKLPATQKERVGD
jgi:tetratricopeptide (TPR) repeat protein